MTFMVKIFFSSALVIPGLIWSGTSVGFAIGMAIALAIISYVIGDLIILSQTNNTFATVADFVLSFGLLWAAIALFNQPVYLTGLFITSFVLAIAEYFYHQYLQLHGVHHSKHPG